MQKIGISQHIGLLQQKDAKQREDEWGKVHRKPYSSFHEFFPFGVNRRYLIPPVSDYDNMCKELTTKKSIRNSVSKVCYFFLFCF